MPAAPSPPAEDLDLRVLRYFTAVAQHQHFGRAAAALGITQPSLSRQVRRLERQLGTQLLDRIPEGVRLTAAGTAFLPHAQALVRAAGVAAAHMRALTEPARFTVGYYTTIIVTPAVRELRRRHPSAQVQAVHLAWDEPRIALLDHRVDAAVTRLPVQADGLDVQVLYDEPRTVVVAEDHPLAGRAEVTVEDIAGEPLPRVTDVAWNAFWRIDPRPDGSPAPDGPLVSALEEKLELIAGGQAVAIMAAGDHEGLLRPDLRAIPLRDAEPSQVALITRAGDRSPLVADFRALVRGLLTGPVPPPPPSGLT